MPRFKNDPTRPMDLPPTPGTNEAHIPALLKRNRLSSVEGKTLWKIVTSQSIGKLTKKAPRTSVTCTEIQEKSCIAEDKKEDTVDTYATLRYVQPKKKWLITDSQPTLEVTKCVAVYRPRTSVWKDAAHSPPFSLNLQLQESTVHPEPLSVYSLPDDVTSSECLSRGIEQRTIPRLCETVRLGNGKDTHAMTMGRWIDQQTAIQKKGSKLCASQDRYTPIQKHGVVSTGPKSAQPERFYPDTAFWHLPERRGPDKELPLCLKWSNRYLCGPPLPTEPQRETGVAGDMKRSPSEVWAGKPRKPVELQIVGLGARKMQGLHRKEIGVRGTSCDAGDGFVSLHSSKARTDTDVYVTSERFPWTPERHVTSERHPKASERVAVTLESQPGTSDKPPSTQRVIFAPSESSRVSQAEPQRYNRPCIQVANHVYPWKEKCTEGILEIGLQSNAGIVAKTVLQLTNRGCTALRYVWYQESHTDHFGKARYRHSKFFFDSSEHTLLPQDSVSLRVQFYADHPGKWCERWRLRTTPLLGPGMDGIIVNFWGIALEDDYNLVARQQLGDELEQLAVKRMISHLVQDTVKSLPIREESATRADEIRSWKRPFVLSDDVLEFEHNSEWHYNSKAVHQILHICNNTDYIKTVDNIVRDLFARKSSDSVGGQDSFGRKRLDGISVELIRDRCLQLPELLSEAMLEMLSEALASMSYRRDAVESNKYLVCRIAIMRALDDVGGSEIQLRRNLGEGGKEITYRKVVVIPSRNNFREGDTLGTIGESNDVYYLEKVQEVDELTKEKASQTDYESSESNVPEPAKETALDTCPSIIDTRAQYHAKLYAIIYSRLAALFESLHSLLISEDHQFNPLMATRVSDPCV